MLITSTHADRPKYFKLSPARVVFLIAVKRLTKDESALGIEKKESRTQKKTKYWKGFFVEKGHERIFY